MEPVSESREEIREKRRERRKLKKEREKLKKEDEARKKLLQNESQKVCVLDQKSFENIKKPSETRKFKNKKVQENQKFSLLDFLAIKEKRKRQEKKNFLRTTKPVQRKGKVKFKKNVTTLKKIIKKFRTLKLENKGNEKKSKENGQNSGKYIHSNNFRR